MIVVIAEYYILKLLVLFFMPFLFFKAWIIIKYCSHCLDCHLVPRVFISFINVDEFEKDQIRLEGSAKVYNDKEIFNNADRRTDGQTDGRT